MSEKSEQMYSGYKLGYDKGYEDGATAERTRREAAEAALYRIFQVASHELTVQSRLSAAGPGSAIAAIVLEALGDEKLRAMIAASGQADEGRG